MFHRSVVLVLEHGAWGSRGVIVNKALHRAHPGLRAAITTAGGRVLLDALSASSSPFSPSMPSVSPLLGGPVDPRMLTLIHNDAAAVGGGGEGGDGASRWEVAPGLFVETTDEGDGGSGNEVRSLGLLSRWSGRGGPGVVAVRAFFGYAGWSARQLASEIRRGDWCVWFYGWT